MATRNVISISKKHRSHADVERRKYEESLLNSDGLDLENIPATEFVNETARKEYDRILHRLRKKSVWLAT